MTEGDIFYGNNFNFYLTVSEDGSYDNYLKHLSGADNWGDDLCLEVYCQIQPIFKYRVWSNQGMSFSDGNQYGITKR